MAGAKESAPAATAPPRAPRSAKAARTAAAAAAARRGLLSLVADVLLLVCVGALWACCATNATAIAASWALCPCSPAALVAEEASRAARLLALQVLLPLGLPLLFWRNIKDRAHAREGGRHDPSALEVTVLAFCTLVILVDLLIQKLAPTKVFCFWLAMSGSGLTDVARFVASVTACFGFLPGFFLHVLQS